MQATKRNRTTLWILFTTAFVFSLSFVLIPFLLIQPFKAQTAARVTLSFLLRRWSPVLTVVLFLIALGAHWRLWSESPIWKRIVTSIGLFLMVGIVWFSQQNYFEWIFNPLLHPQYVASTQSDFLSDNDMVLAVSVNGDHVAYPVRLLAYHHLVEDTVGGEPVVATY